MIPNINLLPNYERQNSKKSVIFFIAIILWLVLIVFIALQFYLLTGEKKQLQSMIHHAEIDRQILEQQLNDINNSTHEISIEQLVNIARNLRLPASNIINEVHRQLPDDESKIIQYSYNGSLISLQTRFPTIDALAEYIDRINNVPFISNVSVNTVTALEISENAENTSYSAGIQLQVDRVELTRAFGGNSNE